MVKFGMSKTHFSVSALAQRLFLAFALLSTGVALGTVANVATAEAQSISNIVVEGNQRITDETIRAYVQMRPGGRYDAFLADESIKELFATGLFADVQISRRGNAVVVRVRENPVVNRVAFEGNRTVNNEQLTAEVQTQPRSVYSPAIVQADVARILAAYRAVGRFGASVEPKIIELPDNRVNVAFEINESARSKIARISFVGNRAFSDGALRNVIDTRESGLLTLLNRRDVYDSNRLEADKETLRRHYLSKGYADFRVISAVADFDQDRNTFFITFTVDEGQQYRVGNVDIRSNVTAIDPESLRRNVSTRTGQIYNATLVDKTLEDITFQLASSGYAFAQVRPRGDRNVSEATIDLTYVIEEGARVYIDRIDIRGNTRTMDSVIRREFDFVEGDAYNSVLINLARKRLEDLEYFDSVRFTREPGSAPDRIILVVDVVEKATGNFSIGGGYEQMAGFVADISLTERNFLGRGHEVRIALRQGQRVSDYQFGFTEPFFLGRRIAAGFDIYRRTNDFTRESGYDLESRGGVIRFGFRMSDQLRIDTRYNYDDRRIKLEAGNTNISPVIRLARQNTVSSVVGYTITYNSLDRNLNPRNGLYGSFSQDFAGLGGDARYVKTEIEAAVVTEIVGDIVGLVRARAGNITGLDGRVDVYDSFFWGSDLVRGFAPRGIGPRYISAGINDSLGGINYAGITAELRAPIPLIPRDFGLQAAVFADAGTVFGVGNVSRLSAAERANIADDNIIRSSVGVGIIWASPFGPIRADYAHVLNRASYDKRQAFRFGTAGRF